MKTFQLRNGNVIVITMFCLILVMFIAAMVLDVGLIGVNGNDSDLLADANSLTLVTKADAEPAATGRDNSPAALDENDVLNDVPETAEIETAAADDNGTKGDEAHQPFGLQTVADDAANRPNPSEGNSVRAAEEPDTGGTDWNLPLPRDFVFVVDLSGSMNDDTEPAWATQTIDERFAATRNAGAGEALIQQFFSDLNFGSYPGELEYIGQTLGGIPENSNAYHEMTKNDGKLTESSVADEYRIENSDDELTRKMKAYKWMIDNQIKRLMPAAKPTPDSSVSYDYWEKYLDYIMVVKFIGPRENKKTKKRGDGDRSDGPVPGLGHNQLQSWPHLVSLLTNAGSVSMLSYSQQETERGWVPPNVDRHRIYKFNNPNKTAYPNADSNTRWKLRNRIGYRTYAQFLLDWGRDGQPDSKSYVQSSINSTFCPYHDEEINGETFSFPPRTQPMHTVRQSLISALQQIRDRNFQLGMTSQRDLVSIIAYDHPDNRATLVQSLTDDYDEAMNQCTTLQATSDNASSTATELGLLQAYEYLKPLSEGGVGREGAKKIVVVITDGRPTAHVSADTEINAFVNQNEDREDFYRGGYVWKDAAVMQAKIMESDGWYLYSLGVGFGADYEFLNRMTRMGSIGLTGQSTDAAGNPKDLGRSLQNILDQTTANEPVSFVK